MALRARLVLLAALVPFLATSAAFGADTPWGANYFPNVSLVTHDGATVRFFDDLIKDKIVSINFIYTTCVDTCPLETAQLVKVQQILGDRLGKDVFFYSITIDPQHDTPTVLKEYKERFGARWTFLTGNSADIILLRRKLGLYVEEIQDGSNNHNVNLIIGNQATGRWMKRSPFENPHVLADQIGNWLSDWKAPQRGEDYSNAPELRNVTPGEQLFRTRCATCHSLNGDELDSALGPDLLGITQRRDRQWLLSWLRAPDQMLEKKDPIAMRLYAKYNNLAMPNMRLNEQEALNLIEYMNDEGRPRKRQVAFNDEATSISADSPQSEGSVVKIVDAWVREADSAAKANAGYMTLVNAGRSPIKLVKIESGAFEKIEMHEMKSVDGLMTMREANTRTIPASGLVQFSPGGWHLMLKAPTRSLVAGDKVDVTFTFDSGLSQTVSLDVASR